MQGAGVFVTTGFVAITLSGPAVILSYAIAGVSALLSSLCYAGAISADPQPSCGCCQLYLLAVCNFADSHSLLVLLFVCSVRLLDISHQHHPVRPLTQHTQSLHRPSRYLVAHMHTLRQCLASTLHSSSWQI
jgi:hypothetical protein